MPNKTRTSNYFEPFPACFPSKKAKKQENYNFCKSLIINILQKTQEYHHKKKLKNSLKMQIFRLSNKQSSLY
jgi:hypothetical protein